MSISYDENALSALSTCSDALGKFEKFFKSHLFKSVTYMHVYIYIYTHAYIYIHIGLSIYIF